MIDLTLAKLANAHTQVVERDEKARLYSEQVAKRKKARNTRKKKLTKCAVIAGMVLVVGSVSILGHQTQTQAVQAKSEFKDKHQLTCETKNFYKGIIVSVNEDTQNITVETEDGNLWDFYGNGYTEGQSVTVEITDGYKVTDCY